MCLLENSRGGRHSASENVLNGVNLEQSSKETESMLVCTSVYGVGVEGFVWFVVTS